MEWRPWWVTEDVKYMAEAEDDVDVKYLAVFTAVLRFNLMTVLGKNEAYTSKLHSTAVACLPVSPVS